MKKYYLTANKKKGAASSAVAINLGDYYKKVERNYDETEKYYIQAIDNERDASRDASRTETRVKAMISLGDFYQYFRMEYEQMKKYYLMAIRNGNIYALHNLSYYYETQYYKISYYKSFYPTQLNNETCFISYYDLHNFACSIIKSSPKIYIVQCSLFTNYNKYNISKQTINIFCKIIIDKYKYLHLDDFNYCATNVISYINNANSYQLNNLADFMKCIGKLYYENTKYYRVTHNKCIRTLLKSNECGASQLFMEYLNFHYYEYLEKKYSPDPPGSGYIKTKNHFESIVTKAKK
jgi:hypothetical protein